ncbi:MAG: V-type ATP synthase subunit E family protein [Acholeplasmataceae bacterium]|nr:hypothetical protein [Acholeplasmataceae bacterium]
MAYYNEDQLRRYFDKAISRESEEQIHKLQKEIEYLYNREVKKITEEIDVKRQFQMAKELKEVQIHYQEELNLIGSGYDEKLIVKRQDMVKVIFESIKDKLKSYAKTADYETWFMNHLNQYDKYLKNEKFQLIISSDDTFAEKQINQVLKSYKFELIKQKSIQFGGFILVLPDKNIEIDETLDARLNEQKEWFLNHSKLFIRR